MSFFALKRISDFHILTCVMERGMFEEQPIYHYGLCLLTVQFCILLCLCGMGGGGVVVLVWGVEDRVKGIGICFI
jgi:hypothetical protein